MGTWIFQGNPYRFDIEAYLGSRPVQFVWLVTRYAEEMRVGDRVFLYRVGGDKPSRAGIIAEAEIVGLPELRAEQPDAVSFWRGTTAAEAGELRQRALLRLIRSASSREILRRDWLLEDPILKELPNLKMAAGTNYPVKEEQATRRTHFGTARVSIGLK